MVVLVHENHDNWPNVTAVQQFSRGFTTQILYILSVVPNIYQKINYIRLSYVYFFNMSTWNVLFDKNNNNFAHERNIQNWAHFPNWRWKVPSVDLQ